MHSEISEINVSPGNIVMLLRPMLSCEAFFVRQFFDEQEREVIYVNHSKSRQVEESHFNELLSQSQPR